MDDTRFGGIIRQHFRLNWGGAMNARALAIAACLSFALAASASAETAKWGQVGGWDIRVDQTIGNGCYAAQTYEDGTTIRAGVNPENKSLFFTLANRAWRSLEIGKIYQLRFTFDGQSVFTGNLKAIPLGSNVALYHSDVSYEFTSAFMQRNSVRIHYQGTQIGHLSLRNTYAAMAEVVNCQVELASAGRGGSRSPAAADPFSGGARRQSDPFSR